MKNKAGDGGEAARVVARLAPFVVEVEVAHELESGGSRGQALVAGSAPSDRDHGIIRRRRHQHACHQDNHPASSHSSVHLIAA